MNKLTKYIIAIIAVVALAFISFHFPVNVRNIPMFFLILTGRTLVVCCTMFLYLELVFDLRGLINIRYRIVKPPEYRYIHHAEYLTLNIFFIPVWKPVKYKMHSYEVQNIFGATFNRYYDVGESFTSEEEAMKEIEKHKEKCKENRLKWTKNKRKEKATIKYV